MHVIMINVQLWEINEINDKNGQDRVEWDFLLALEVVDFPYPVQTEPYSIFPFEHERNAIISYVSSKKSYFVLFFLICHLFIVCSYILFHVFSWIVSELWYNTIPQRQKDPIVK